MNGDRGVRRFTQSFTHSFVLGTSALNPSPLHRLGEIGTFISPECIADARARTMTRFRCSFFARPATRLDRPLDLRFEEQGTVSPTRVTVIPRSELDGSGKAYQVGLRVIVEVDASDQEAALKGAGAYAEAVLSTMALASG